MLARSRLLVTSLPGMTIRLREDEVTSYRGKHPLEVL